MKYKVIVKWCEEEAYDKAIEKSSDGSSYASDCCLLSAQVMEADEE